MNKYVLTFILSFFVMFFFITCSESDTHSPLIEGLTIQNYPKVDGSTSAAPLNMIIACRLLGLEYKWVQNPYFHDWSVQPQRSELSDIIKSSQTHHSIINLIDNNTDLVLSARIMSQDEENYAAAAGVSLVQTPIALDAFIFIINPRNFEVSSLTIQQIQQIYTGRITNWRTLGGNDAVINPYIRNANSGSQELMESLVMKDIPIIELPESQDILFTMSGAVDAVSNDEDGICYTLYYYKYQILRGSYTKTIAINGIHPDIDTISNNTYPLVSPVYALIRTDLDKSSMAYKVYEWLQTEEGKQVISESGYVPMF